VWQARVRTRASEPLYIKHSKKFPSKFGCPSMNMPPTQEEGSCTYHLGAAGVLHIRSWKVPLTLNSRCKTLWVAPPLGLHIFRLMIRSKHKLGGYFQIAGTGLLRPLYFEKVPLPLGFTNHLSNPKYQLLLQWYNQ